YRSRFASWDIGKLGESGALPNFLTSQLRLPFSTALLARLRRSLRVPRLTEGNVDRVAAVEEGHGRTGADAELLAHFHELVVFRSDLQSVLDGLQRFLPVVDQHVYARVVRVVIAVVELEIDGPLAE